jgi:FMN phosphatase YigB (HAD superfamily)
MTAASEMMFLLDVDNTLLDNDGFAADPGAQSFVESWQALMQRIASKRATLADCRSQEPRR